MEWEDCSPSRDHDACGVGFVATLKREPSHQIVIKALAALQQLEHRGGMGADGASADGCGVLLSLPQEFFRRQALSFGIELPPAFAVGMAFLSEGGEESASDLLSSLAPQFGLKYLGHRRVPTDFALLPESARGGAPTVHQFFFASVLPVIDLERQLFLLRKRVESLSGIYFASLSGQTVVYKGLLTPRQLPLFYPDLVHPDFQSTFAIFHQRYSTN